VHRAVARSFWQTGDSLGAQPGAGIEFISDIFWGIEPVEAKINPSVAMDWLRLVVIDDRCEDQTLSDAEENVADMPCIFQD